MSKVEPLESMVGELDADGDDTYKEESLN